MVGCNGLLDKFAESIRFEPAGVTFIGVDVSLKIEAGVNPDNDVIVGGGAWAVDLELHGVEVLDAVEGGVVRVHVDVGLCSDDAFIHFKIAVGAHEHAAGSAGNVSRHANGNVEAKCDRVGECKLHLVEVAAWAENAEVGNHPAARAD